MAKKKIMIVEDEGIVALDISQILESLNFEVCKHVTSAEEVLPGATQTKPDLILMDVNLKGKMDGIDAAGLVYEKLKTPVVFLTAHADESTLQRAKVTHPYGYILKPFESDDLKATIELALHRKASEVETEKTNAGEHEVDDFVPGDFTHSSSAEEILSSVPALRALSKADISSLAQVAAVKEFEAGQTISEYGKPPSSGFVVLSGRLAVFKSSSAGKELAVDLLPAGDSWGIIIAMMDLSSEVGIKAQTMAKLLLIPRNQLQQLAKRNPELHHHVAVELTKRLNHSQELAMSLAHSRVETRIASALVALGPRIGKETAVKGQSRIFLTRKELAELTGTTPETAIRVTKAFERDGLLDLSRPGIIKVLSAEKLKELTA